MNMNKEINDMKQKRDFSSLIRILITCSSVNSQSYASILYLRLPPGFRIIIRGKDVEHHNIVNDMMLSKKVTYRPQPGASGIPTDLHVML